MTALVLDGSAVLSFLLKDEQSASAMHAAGVLAGASDWDLLVPGHFWMEAANGVLMAERRNRASRSEADQALQLLFELKLTTDDETSQRCRGESLELAREHNLTLYDAAYLELALRRRAGLATLDRALQRAATARGIHVVA